MTLFKYSEAAQIGITAAFAFLVIADLFGNSLTSSVDDKIFLPQHRN